MPTLENSNDNPYIQLLPPGVFSIPPSNDGARKFNITINNTFPLDKLDFAVGQIKIRYELEMDFSGTDQTYIGKVFENPDRFQFGTYCFSRNGYVKADTRQLLEYKKQLIIWESEVYSLSLNMAAMPRKIKDIELTKIELENDEAFEFGVGGEMDLGPLKAFLVYNDGGRGGIFGTLAFSDGSGDPGSTTANGAWRADPDCMINITKILPGSTLFGNIQVGALHQLGTATNNLGEILYDISDKTGEITLYKELDKVHFHLYQGIGAEATLKSVKCGVFQSEVPNSIYTPPNGGGYGYG
jgi:hypothetical protein